MTDKVELEIGAAVAKTAEGMARGIWFASGKDEPNLDNSNQFLDLVACCSYALSGKRLGVKLKDN